MKDIQKRKLIAVVGPTASGKTGIGVQLAKDFDGEIVSADSRQVYRGLDIGTGKDLAEYSDVKYHLIDVKNPGEKFTLFDYLPLARAAIEDIFARGKVPIIVGGTGLYVQALTEGFRLKPISNSKFLISNQIPNPKSQIFSREQLENMTIEQLQNILQELDITTYENLADKQNPHRLIRTIEKAQEGLKPTKEKPDFDALQIGMMWPREVLYERIDKRVNERFEQGMLDEIIGLLKSEVDKDWLIHLGLEYRIITDFVISNFQFPISALPAGRSKQIPNSKIKIKNNITIEQYNNEFELMKQQLKLRIHQFAKRQLTWFGRFPGIVWENDYEKIKKKVEKFLN